MHGDDDEYGEKHFKLFSNNATLKCRKKITRIRFDWIRCDFVQKFGAK